VSEAERRQTQHMYLPCPRCKAVRGKSCKDDLAAYGDTYSGVHRERMRAVREFLGDAPFLLMQKLERIEDMLQEQARGTSRVENMVHRYPTRESEPPRENPSQLQRCALDLEWSWRTHTIIETKFSGPHMRATTVADLVAIPPAEWLKVPRCGMLVLREMDKMFKSLGVEWPGEWPRR